MVRSFFLFLSRRERLRRRMETSRAAQRLAARFVAGDTLADALDVSRRLNAEGIAVTLDHRLFRLLLGWFGLAAAAVTLIVIDQRRRCRTCLRRLRMPVETGSWGRMLFLGRPRIESICPYGHGTLKEDELQIYGSEAPEWTRNSGDLWEDLCVSGKEPEQQP